MTDLPLDEIRCEDCRTFTGSLPDDSIDGVVTDPPYGEGMGYVGDGSLIEAENLLRSFLTAAYPKVKARGHVAVFFTARNVDAAIDAVKASGFMFRRLLFMYVPKGGARPYLGWLPRTQVIVLGQKYLPESPERFHGRLAEYLSAALKRKGLSRSEVARVLGCDNRLVLKWTRLGDPAWCLPTPRFYAPLRELLDLDDRFDCLLDPDPHAGRDDFPYRHDTYVVDDALEAPALHPSQKPLSVVEHLVQCVAPRGGVVLDGFMGSGTTAEACARTGRRFIGCDLNPEYVDMARRRIEASMRAISSG